jgi:flagellar P-ring protein precursor FlgI
MAEAIKAAGVEARAVDSRQVVVDVPEAQRQNPVELIAKVEAVDFETDVNARIVLNARTGTVVMGSNVRLGNVALAHGGLQVEVQAQNAVSQPNPLTQGQGVGVQNAQVNATEARSSVHLVEGGASLAELVQALNALGVTPRDLIDVLQAMKSAGALNAELEIQ